MKSKSRLASLLAFVASSLCFTLPFGMVSCNGMPVQKLSGLDLAMASKMPGSAQLGLPPSHFLMHYFALAALLCSLVGIIAFFLGRLSGPMGRATGAIGAAALVLLAIRISSKSISSPMALIQGHTESGLYLALILMIVGAAVRVPIVRSRVRMWMKKYKPSAISQPAAPAPPSEEG